MTKRMSVSDFVATACLAVSVAGVAYAEGADDSDAAAHAIGANANDVQSRIVLDEVVVTAQKRSERIMDVPLSVTAINAADLANNGDVQLKDYFDQVPGLSISARGSGRTSLILRGIATSNVGNPTVGVTIDNAPFGVSASSAQMVPDIDPFDVDHVEVLRGPQGTLYGASSIGGLVKYVMAKPDTQNFTGRAEADTSSTQHGGDGYGVRGSVNLPVTDSFAFRLSAFQRQDAGYIKDVGQDRANVNEDRVQGGRVAALWKINDALTVESSALFQDSTAEATSDVDVNFAYQPLYGPFEHQRLPGTDGFKGTIRFYDTVVTADLGWAKLESTSAYEQLRHIGPQDVTGTFGGLAELILGVQNAGVAIDNNTRFNQFSQEFRLSSPQDGRAFQWLYGLFYVNNGSETFQQIRVVDINTGIDAGLSPLYSSTSPTRYREYAGFANFDYQFTKRFDVQMGGRYGHNTQDSSSPTEGPLNGGFTNFIGHSGEGSFTFQVSPRFRLSDDLLAYVRVASGYRPGGPNGLIPGVVIPLTYGADKTVNYELGLKGEFLDRTLTVESALFYIDWTNIQILFTDQSTGYSYFTNGGTAKSQGVEGSAQWHPIKGLTVSGSLAYTDAKLTENLLSGNGFSGDQLPYSSKESGSLNVQQTYPVAGHLSGFVGGGVSYVGERLGDFGNTAQTPRFRLPGYAIGDLRTGLEGRDWVATVYLKNVGDRMGYVNAQSRNATSGISAYGVSLIQPRTVGLSVSKNW
jgi:iron complex outermembrane receptor protein